MKSDFLPASPSDPVCVALSDDQRAILVKLGVEPVAHALAKRERVLAEAKAAARANVDVAAIAKALGVSVENIEKQIATKALSEWRRDHE